MAKVCIPTTVHRRYDTRVLAKEACSLAKKYDTVLLVADGLQSEQIDGVTIKSIVSRKPKNEFERAFRYTKIMYQAALAEDADVYEIMDVEMLLVGIKLRKHGKKVFFDAHESIQDTILDKTYLPKWSLRFLSKALHFFEKWAVRHMDAVITVTPFLKQRYESYGCKTYLVCNYPRLQDYPNAQNNYVNREISAVYAGLRSDTARGVLDMVKASQTSGVSIKVLGGMSQAFEQELCAIDQKNLLTLTGWIAPNKVADILEQSLIGLVVEHPTGNAVNAYCVKMFEYMIAGNVIISSDIPLWKQIVEENRCGICVPAGNVQAIADAEKYIVEHPKEAQEMSQSGKKAVLEKYNWTTQEAVLFSAYEELLD